MTMSRPRRGNSAWRIFRWPLLLALVSGAGLVGALLTDAVAADMAWTLAIAAPVLVAGTKGFLR
jgi:hypothetical protein